MKILIINCGSRAIKELVSVTGKLGADITLAPMQTLPLKSTKGFAGIIISGSPLMWSECKNEHLKKFGFLKKITIPILGVCFSHQMIGILHGAEIYQKDLLKKHVFINFHGQDKITKGFNKQAKFMEYHKEYISLPEKFVLLATSEKDNVEIIKHPTKAIYGIQFHPELSGKNGKKILKNFFNICGTNTKNK